MKKVFSENNGYNLASISLSNFYKSILLLFLFALVGFVNVRPFFTIIQAIFIGIFAIRFLTRKYHLSRYTLWSVLTIVYALCSIFISNHQAYTFTQTISFIQPLIFCNLIIPYMLESQGNYKFVLHSLLISAAGLLIRLLLVTPLLLWGTTRVGETIGYNPNTIGLILSLTAILAYNLYLSDRKIIFFLVTVLLGGASLFTGSRKAFAILVVGIFLLSIITKSDKKQFIFSFVLGVLLLTIFVALILNWEPLYQVIGIRIDSLVQGLLGGNTDSSTSTRFNMISVGIELFSQKPFFGYGLGNFKYFSGYDVYSHNNYIELLVSFGLFGTVLFYSMHFYILQKGMRLLKNRGFANNSAILASIIIAIILLMDLGMVSYYGEFSQLLISISYVSISDKKQAILRNTNGNL